MHAKVVDGEKHASNLKSLLTPQVLWYKVGTLLCSCCRIPVLSQHPQIGSRSHESDAIGQSQGGSCGKGPNLRRQVQNFAAHGMVGCFVMRRRKLSMLAAAVVLALAALACNLLDPSPPTPFIFPTPDLTLTAIFSVLDTPTVPPVQTATPPALGEDTSTVPPIMGTFIPGTPVVTGTPSVTNTSTAVPSLRAGNTVTAAYLNSPPAIDGDLGDWSIASYPANHVVYGSNLWDNPEDLSARFMVGWDNNFLYIAARVTDEGYVQNASGAELYLGDSLEILFDAGLPGDFNVAGLNNDDYQLGISPGRGEPGDSPEAYLWYPSHLAGGRSQVQIGAQRSSDGYDVESAIPWSVLGVTPQEGRTYGFAFSISDNDRTGQVEQQTMVSNVSTRRLTNPTTWGNLTLDR